MLSCWKKNGGPVKHIWGNEYAVQELLNDLQGVDFFVAQNAKMELKWLSRAGADLHHLLPFDTMLAEYTLLGNRREPLHLGALSSKYGYGVKDKYVDGLMNTGVCPSEMPQGLLLQRCVKDVLQTEAVFKKQRMLLVQQKKLKPFFTKCIVAPALADIEMRGMTLDPQRVRAEWAAEHEASQKNEQEIVALVGEVNMNSPKQVADLLYNKLQFKPLKVKGKPVFGTDRLTISKLTPETDEQRKFLELKLKQSQHDANLSKALDKFKECVDNDDVLLGIFNQAVAQTHRLSSSGTKYRVQFQNMARRYKTLFRARRKGWLIGEPDGAQIEFRVAAFNGQDKTAYDSILNGEDVHQFTSDTLTAAGQPTDRQNAKAHTFKPLYGGMSGTKAEQAYYAAFREKYPGIAGAQERWKQTVLRFKKLRLPTGLEFFWPDTAQSRDGYISNSTQICNYPVQYLATAEIVPIALMRLWHDMYVLGMQSFLVNTVHDSAVAELHPDEVELFHETAVKAFTEYVYFYLDYLYGIKFNVPLGVGFKAGEYWSAGKEIKTQVVPPYPAPTG